MADEDREPPPLFEDDDMDPKELEDDDIFQSEKKVATNQVPEKLQDEKLDDIKVKGENDIHDVPFKSPEENIFTGVKPKAVTHRSIDESSEGDTFTAVKQKSENYKSLMAEKASSKAVMSDSPAESVSSWLQSDIPNEVTSETKTSFFKSRDDVPKVSVTESSTMYASVNKLSFGFNSMSKKEQANSDQMEEGTKYSIDITITGSKRVGDGINAYVVYKICTKTIIPDFRNTEMEVYRRFSDFLGLREKLAEKHLHQGIIVPPSPEKSIIGMAKIKVSKEESSSLDFVEQRRAALERFLNRIAQHPVLQTDPNFVDFLEVEGDLPKATNTSALSGAGVMRLFNRVGDNIGKITYKMEETDQWFEEKTLQIDALDIQLRKLHASLETLVGSRRELGQNTGILAKSIASVGESEEHPPLSRALAQLALVEEELDKVHEVQAEDDFFIISEFVKDYIGILQSVKDVFHERVKLYKTWKDSEVTLAKKREIKVRMELALKLDKIQDVSRDISEWELNVDKSQQDFERISKNIRKEMKRFELQRCKDFRRIIIAHLESLLNHEQQIIRRWESFLPETQLII